MYAGTIEWDSALVGVDGGFQEVYRWEGHGW